MRNYVLDADSIVRSLMLVVMISLLSIFFESTATAQKPATRKSSLGNGRMRVWIPSGFVDGIYWVYLDGRLKSSPPNETRRGNFAVVPLAEGSGWEIWTGEGFLTSSKRYEGWLSSYLAAGDRYKVFQTIEYEVAPGQHSIEVLVPAGASRSLSPLPFTISRKYEVVMQPGQTSDVYPDIPSDWNPSQTLPTARMASPCYSSTFDLRKMQDSFLAWGRSYQDDPLVKLLHAGRGSFKTGSPVLELELPSGPREFDGQQIERLVGEINRRFYTIRYDHNEIDQCKIRFPQYSKAFDEYHKTISFIDGDLASLQKLATDLKSNR